ncbi:MAG: FtsW/RodA/SpoVE family cell cycle protein [Oscillospiraceae bacterium]|jgi:cell division protein FtsW (lipid II flippase)|nr:FtsW/RodA/SpoVE family cell cycle protein [Oscillospiraceae bacterium]
MPTKTSAKKMHPTKKTKRRGEPWVLLMLLVTVFQALSFAPVLLRAQTPEPGLLLALLCYPPAEWLFLVLLRAAARPRTLSPEILGLWLSGIGLCVCGSFSALFAWKQAAAIGGGMVVYAVVRWLIADTDRAVKVRPAVAAAAVGLLAVNLVLGVTINGQRNWMNLGGFSIQPSELVKIAFVFVGAATLERLQRTPSITRYLLFAMGCVGALFLMKDFGAALIFFATYLLICFLRSGDLRAIGLVSAGAGMCAALVLLFKSSVAARFRVYRHIWEHIHDTGYQQTRVLIYGASGGLFGLGMGNGRLRGVFAASTDLVFGVICEEFGLLLAFLIPLCFVALALYAFRQAQRASSSFYTIANIAAAGLLLIQTSLHIFGITDLLPLTGVTLPFVSRGGTSMLCAWGLLALTGAAAAQPRQAAKTTPKKAKATRGLPANSAAIPQ